MYIDETQCLYATDHSNRSTMNSTKRERENERVKDGYTECMWCSSGERD